MTKLTAIRYDAQVVPLVHAARKGELIASVPVSETSPRGIVNRAFLKKLLTITSNVSPLLYFCFKSQIPLDSVSCLHGHEVTGSYTFYHSSLKEFALLFANHSKIRPYLVCLQTIKILDAKTIFDAIAYSI